MLTGRAKWVVVVAAVLVALILAFPPWIRRNEYPIGYRSIFTPPRYSSMDWSRIAAELGVVLVVAGAALAVVRRPL